MSHKTLLSMFRSTQYNFRASEPAVVVRAEDSLSVGETRSSVHGAPHSRPFSVQHIEVPDVPQPDEPLLCVMGEKMLRKARAANQPLSMVVMQVYDLPEVELVFGGAGAARETRSRSAVEPGFDLGHTVSTLLQ